MVLSQRKKRETVCALQFVGSQRGNALPFLTGYAVLSICLDLWCCFVTRKPSGMVRRNRKPWHLKDEEKLSPVSHMGDIHSHFF